MTIASDDLPRRSPPPTRANAISLLRPFVVLLAVALAPSGSARAGVNRWTPFGPGGGVLQSLVASSHGGIYTTTNFATNEVWLQPAPGEPWIWRGLGLGRPARPGTLVLAVHPRKPAALWAVATDAAAGELQSVFRSADGGVSWSRLYTGAVDFQVARLTVAPTRNSVVLLAESSGDAPKRLWLSSDAGVSWSVVAGAIGPIAAPPDEPGTIYGVASPPARTGLVKSTNGGQTFRPTGALPIATGDEIRTLHATYGRFSIVFVSLGSGGLYRSRDRGGSWHRVGFAGAGPAALASEPADPRGIYAINGPGLYGSQLGGRKDSFRHLGTVSFHESSALAAAPGGPYLLTDGDLVRRDAQHGFTRVEKTGIQGFGVDELRIHPRDPLFLAQRRYTRCFGGPCDSRTLLSADGGTTYSSLGSFIFRSFVGAFDLAFDPIQPERWLVSMAGFGLLLHEPGNPDLFGDIVRATPEGTVEIAAGGVLLAGGMSGVLVSENSGASWATAIDAVVPPSPEHPAGRSRRFVDLEASPYAAERVIARALEFTPGVPNDPGDVVLYRSLDAGRTWTKLRDGDADVEFVPGAPARLFLLVWTASGTELRRSEDFGATSMLIRSFPTSDAVTDLATDANAPADLYAATWNGVLRSRDGGVTWQATPGGFIPFGPNRRWLARIQVAPDLRGRLLGSPVEGGLFENWLSD